MTEKDQSEKAESRIYELGYHIVSSIPEEKLPAGVTALRDILEAEGAITISEDFPKLKHLSYMMTKVVGPRHLKFDTAYFGWMKFEVSPESVLKIKNTLELKETILRFIIIKTVRENTLSVIKAPSYHSEEKPMVSGSRKETPIKSPMSEAEMDKTIEALVVE